jgi:triacylglycerol esterase/lipase EstA (alpha/beta hydrolase family)
MKSVKKLLGAARRITWRAAKALDKEFNDPDSHWERDTGSPKVIIFVHGLFSESPRAWSSKDAYWPDLLKQDPGFEGWDILMANWYSTLLSAEHDIERVAKTLDEELRRLVGDGRAKIVFVCHSLGGVVVRQLLIANPWWVNDHKIGLFTLSTPVRGARLASKVAKVSATFQHSQALDLQLGSEALLRIEADFRLLLEAHPGQVTGKELFESHGIAPRNKVFRLLDAFSLLPKALVGRETQGNTFGPAEEVPGTDHNSISRPHDQKAIVYRRLAEFIQKF